MYHETTREYPIEFFVKQLESAVATLQNEDEELFEEVMIAMNNIIKLLLTDAQKYFSKKFINELVEKAIAEAEVRKSNKKEDECFNISLLLWNAITFFHSRVDAQKISKHFNLSSSFVIDRFCTYYDLKGLVILLAHPKNYHYLVSNEALPLIAALVKSKRLMRGLLQEEFGIVLQKAYQCNKQAFRDLILSNRAIDMQTYLYYVKRVSLFCVKNSAKQVKPDVVCVFTLK